MIKDLIRYVIGDSAKEYIEDDNTRNQVSDDFIRMVNDIQKEYGIIFEFKMFKRNELGWRLLPRD